MVSPRKASLALVDSVMAYWSCNFSHWGLRGRRPEEWESQIYMSAKTPMLSPHGGIGWLCIRQDGGHPDPRSCNAARAKNYTCRAGVSNWLQLTTAAHS